MMRVTRIQYPIGQGCFHAGSIHARVAADHDVHEYHYVYDCGSDDREDLGEAIDNYKTQTSRVDALFVSHLDNDHISGLDRLLSAVKVHTVYVPYVNEVVLVLELIQAELDGAISVSLTEARDLGPGAAGGDRSRPGGIALGGRGLPQGLGSASGLSRHPGCPQAGAPPDAREQSALAPSLPPPWRQSP